MEPLSIALGCIALVPPITKTTALIGKFVVEVREARKEMLLVQSELGSLKSVLEFLAQDMKDCPENVFPTALVEDIRDIIANCEVAVKQIEQCIAAHTNDKTTKSVKWVTFGRDSMLSYKSLLHAYQRALNIAIETLNIALSKDIQAATTNILLDTSDLKEDTSHILREIAKLQAKLPDHGKEGDHYILHRYLDSLTNYAESSFGHASTRGPDEDSRRPTPVHEPVNDYTLQPSSSSTTTQSHYPSASNSDSLPSHQTRTHELPLEHASSLQSVFKGPTEPYFTVSDATWCKGSATPISVPPRQNAAEGHTDLVYALCHTKDFIISGSRDESIRVWDVITRRLAYAPLAGHDASVHSLVADQEADILISGGGNGSLITWKLSTGEMTSNIRQAHADSILNIKLNSQYFITTSKDYTAKIWSRCVFENSGERPLSPYTVLRKHPAAINAVVLTEGEAITACGDKQIRVFDIDSGTCIQRMFSHERTIAALALSPDSEFIISAGGDTDIVIHNKRSGREAARLQGHDNLVRALMMLHGDNLIVSGSYDETVALWAFKEDGKWRKERSLDVKETQRILGLDLKQKERNLDFTENVRRAVATGVESAALSSGRVFCMASSGRQIFCGAGCTIIGWDFNDDLLLQEGERPVRTESSESRRKSKGKRLLQHLRIGF